MERKPIHGISEDINLDEYLNVITTALGGEAYLGPTYMHTEIIMVDVSIPGQHVLYKLKLKLIL